MVAGFNTYMRTYIHTCMHTYIHAYITHWVDRAKLYQASFIFFLAFSCPLRQSSLCEKKNYFIQTRQNYLAVIVFIPDLEIIKFC